MTSEDLTLDALYWVTDSRQVIVPEKSVFFAIRGDHHDGHDYIGELYQKGVRQFVVESPALNPERKAAFTGYPDAQFTEVDSSLKTLQQLAAQHRSRFRIPVIGITGSNGKTIVKEWLSQLLANSYVIAKSPKSYNSQVGVPLSVRQLNETHTLGIFEAGISRPHEMQALQPIVNPTLGIFTNIGTAHDEGFRSRKQKVAEKLRLFTQAETLIYRKDYTDIDEEINLLLRAVNPTIRLIHWSLRTDKAAPVTNAVYQAQVKDEWLTLTAEHGHWRLRLPFTDPASVENIIHCVVAMLTLGMLDESRLQSRLNRLRPVSMRLELKEALNGCMVIDDSYNNDVAGLQLALNFLNQQVNRDRKVVILSDVLQSGQREDELYRQIGRLITEQGVSQFIGIGPVIGRNADSFTALPDAPDCLFYAGTDQFLAQFPLNRLQDSVILVKGARSFSFERIVNRLQRKVHGTVLEINLDALTHNLNYYRSKVGTGTKIMVMVKAFAYGSGSAEVAQLLQFHRVDYLAVAYADEGVSLRQNGIDRPIMVMNPAPETFRTLVEHNLEPELYSARVLKEFGDFATTGAVKIHLKLDTGMHRLGFLPNDLPDVITYLKARPNLRVASVFSHLVGADEAQFNSFSREQYERFIAGAATLENGLGYRPIRHLLNSAGIVRFPEFRLDMVRVGIGLYGVEASQLERAQVRPVGTLKTVISQIKELKAGETVGYSRRGVLDHDARIATIALGYADGYDRRLGNGVGQVAVDGVLCPTVGNVCMDMTMIDVTSTTALEGDEVIVFGAEVPITTLAGQIGTIPYEILTGVSERVKRVFYKE
ncbi:bifunctional UDP-N-acetylmuramoyl-tripeptide:D-alanyl-D-alanine ligase/alanine racemase [Nibrella saemangeumensis]|uniref:Alanine racemase n=1 Tax=Nibrella saemangeumensis TaxID=1084526 RepID=A0ABP8MV55_9BACT